MIRIVACRTNHIENPLGYRLGKPVFSYVVEGAEGKRQTAARIRVSKAPDMEAPLWDTGFTDSADSLGCEADIALEARTRYYWDVTVRTDAGEEVASGVNWFETGKMDEPFAAQWITCGWEDGISGEIPLSRFEAAPRRKGRHPEFFHPIAAREPVQSARLYICGLGLYEAFIAGERVSGEYLTPYCNDYDRWLQCQTYDVTNMVRDGAELSVLLGNGWYKGRFGFDTEKKHRAYGHTWKLIAELRIRYADGRETVLGTDDTWQARESRIEQSSIYDGEVLNATLADTGVHPAILLAEKPAPLTDRLSLPVMVQEELTPVALLHTPAGETVLDLGQNIAGIFRLRVHVPKGKTVRLQFGEILQGGNFYRENLRTAKAEYMYVSDGTERVLAPRFTFYGYRYVKVEGVPDLKKEDFTGLALYSDLPRTGEMTTGYPLVNRLIENTEWSMKGNFIDVPTDCPQRDERMGWTGDAQVFSPTACFLRDSYAFFAKYLHDMDEEQREHGGKVPDVIPSFGHPGTASVWGDAACIIPWNLYLFYGDKRILEDQFESMKAWVDYITAVDGDHHGWREVFHYGDWLALDHPSGKPDQVMGATDTGFIASVYYANSARIVAKAAECLGEREDQARYARLSDQVTRDLRREYFSPTERCCIDTQTAHVLTLRYGLADNREKARAALRRKFEESGGKLKTGFVGTPLLLNQLSMEGMDDLAFALLLSEEYPGWLYEVKLGATTIWERWNSVLEDGGISSTGMNSLNHYAYGSVVEWLYRFVAGINPVESAPGFRRAWLRPMPNRALSKLRAKYRSAAGVYEIGWEVLEENRIALWVTVPFGCEADLTLPFFAEAAARPENPIFARRENGVCHLSAGAYEIVYEANAAL